MAFRVRSANAFPVGVAENRFLASADYQSVVERMRLANGLPWPIPITLSASEAEAKALQVGSEVALTDADGEIRGVLTLEEVFVAALK